MVAAAAVVSPTTEWRISKQFIAITDSIKTFEDQCAVLLHLVRALLEIATANSYM